MQRDSFTFRKEWRDALSGLPGEVRLEVYDAIMEYGFSGNLSSLKPIAMLAFNFVKSAIDADNDRINEIRRRRAEAGKKGGAPIGNSNASKTSKNKQNKQMVVSDVDFSPPLCLEVFQDVNKQKQAKQANGCLQETPPILPKEENNIIDSNESLSTNVDSSICPRDDYGEIKDYFNSLIDRYNSAISKLKVIQGDRRKLLAARLKQYGLDSIKEALKKAVSSDFLNGQGGRGFIATFDWIIRPNNFPKVLEGNYDNKQNNNGTSQTTQRTYQGSEHPSNAELRSNTIEMLRTLKAERHARNSEVRK